MMKQITLFISLLIGVATICGCDEDAAIQKPSDDVTVQPAVEVVEEAVVDTIGWLTDFEKAKEDAAARGLPILVNFSGSDWCVWCIRLDEEVFSQPEFKTYASENLVLFLADFPRRNLQSDAVKKQNEALSQKYGMRGFPTILLLKADGSVIGQTGYQRGGADAYVDHLKSFLN